MTQPNVVLDAADRLQKPGPYYLTVHPSRHDLALKEADDAMTRRDITVHVYLNDQQKRAQWNVSLKPAPESRPAPRHDA